VRRRGFAIAQRGNAAFRSAFLRLAACAGEATMTASMPEGRFSEISIIISDTSGAHSSGGAARD